MIGLSSLKDNKEIRNIEKYIRDINDNEIYLDKCFPHSFVEKYIITIILLVQWEFSHHFFHFTVNFI